MFWVGQMPQGVKYLQDMQEGQSSDAIPPVRAAVIAHCNFTLGRHRGSFPGASKLPRLATLMISGLK